MSRSLCILVVCVAVICGATTPCAADQAADKTTIEKAVESNTAAFNARDTKALAAHWSPEAVYISPLAGSIGTAP